MAMNGTNRGNADATAILAINPNASKMSAAELATFRSAWQVLMGADTTYITGNMQVLPVALSGASLANPTGQPVATTGSATAQTGTTTSPSTITGTGSVE